MKRILVTAMIVSSITGCAAMGRGPINQAGSFDDTALPVFTTEMPSPSNDTMPRLVQPATGGAPEIGIPIGGDVYIPVTGGPPVIGIPLN